MSEPTGSSSVAGRRRYEATVHSPATAAAEHDAAVSEFDLDRVPDPDGGTRVIVDEGDIARLVAAGFEVRLQSAILAGPVDPGLVASDDDARAWLSSRMSRLRRSGS